MSDLWIGSLDVGVIKRYLLIMNARTEGSKYDRNLSTTEIAKLIRADIKTAIKAGQLPKGIKVGVRSRYFAGGSSIDLTITAFPGPVLNPALIYSLELSVFEERQRPHYSLPVRKALATLDGLMDAYNYDASDSQFDHFDVNFYGHVSVRCSQEAAERAVLLANDALTDLRVAKSAGDSMNHWLDGYDTSGGDAVARRY